MRWKTLGTKAGRDIGSELKGNKTLSRLEVSGNKFDDDRLNDIEFITKKNLGNEKEKDTNKDIIKEMFSPAKTMPNLNSSRGYISLLPEKSREVEYKTIYNEKFSKRAQTERQLGNAEQELRQERTRNAETHNELLKTVEQEKKVMKINIRIESARSKRRGCSK